MVEWVDTADLKSADESREGSSPFSGTSGQALLRINEDDKYWTKPGPQLKLMALPRNLMLTGRVRNRK